jgi:hypothetical protein
VLRILTNYNETYELDNIPDIIEDDLRFCVLDYSNQNDVDFLFPPVVFLDQFSRPCADLKIGDFHVQVPLDWAIVIADKNTGCLEIIDIKHINDREFQAFCFNPIEGYMPAFLDLELSDVFSDVSWNVPKLANGQLLAVPLNLNPKPLCVLLVRDTNKLPESLDISKVFA